MKARVWSALLGIGVIASSCAFNREAVIDQPVGPPPEASGTAASKPGSDGTLIVYSRFDTGEAPSDDDASMPTHTAYDIYTFDGQFVRHVRNRTGGRFVEAPDSIALPAGRYTVSAMAQEYGTVSVPVVIVSGRTTTIHLDSNEFASAQEQTGAVVRLPDGQIVGWLAQPSVPAEGK
jgi:hypothetical protein